MRARCRLLVVAGLLALGASVPGGGIALADASVGAASYPADSRGGGAEFGEPVGRVARRPVASVFHLAPRTVVAGQRPKIAVRIVQQGVPSVVARVDFTPLHGRGRAVRVDLGRVATGRTVVARWPKGARLRAGTYVVRVHAKDPAGAVLRRTRSASGRTRLTVKAKPKKKAKKPAAKPVVTPQPQPSPTPAPTPTAGGVFPVQGPHSLGGDDARFGAGRTGHTHEGQDVVAAAGVPIVAPVAGTIVSRTHQAHGAGYYLVEDTADGRSFFFAHCQKDSFAVTLGQAVTAGQMLCRVGATGDASGPHLHFEIWVGGWRRSKDSRPVDPLAQLLAWE